jgi:hypothetical protein
MANDPAIVEVAARLSENRLLTVDQWAGMIDARRRFVQASATPKQLQPFFRATEEQIRAVIFELGQRIDRERRQDSKLYKGETVAKLEELARSIDELKAIGPPRPLRWAEEHILMTLCPGVDSTSAEREDAKRTKLHHYNQIAFGSVVGLGV